MTKVVEDFMMIGFLLWEIREYKYHSGMGYADVVEYAEKELNLKRSSIFNFIKLCETYSERTKAGNPTSKLKKSIKGTVEVNSLKCFLSLLQAGKK